MALMIPSTYPSSTPPGEREVFDRLKSASGAEDWIVLHSLEVANHCKRLCGEIDFMILIPRAGIICLEIKSHNEIRRSHNGWYYGRSPQPDLRGPFRQASEGMHSIRNYVIGKVPYYRHILFHSGVCFPFARFEVESPEWDTWQCIDMGKFRRAPLPDLLVQLLAKAADKMEGAGMEWIRDAVNDFSAEKVQRVVDIVRPNFEMVPSANARISCLEAELKHYTHQQYRALDFITKNPRVLFSGPAGTGKTLLAIEAAVRRKRSASDARVVWLCFNRNLMEWIKSNSPLQELQVEVKSLHAWMLGIGGLKVGDASDPAFWTRTLPEAAIHQLLSADSDELGSIDFLVVDEAQDLVSEMNLDFLDLLLKAGLGSGKWMMFGDFDLQDIYQGSGTSGFSVETLNGRCSPVTRCELTVNCRNRPRIASRAQTLADMNPGYTEILRPDDNLEPNFKVYETPAQQVEILAKLLDGLRKENFRARNIVILSPFKDSAAAMLAMDPSWKQALSPSLLPGEEKFRYGTIHAFKGLEAPVIILTDIRHINGREDEKLLYTGLTRSTDRLYALVSTQARDELMELLIRTKS